MDTNNFFDFIEFSQISASEICSGYDYLFFLNKNKDNFSDL